jgi:hypothetical protein
VAAAALFVGLLAGVMLLRSHQSQDDQHRALPPPLPMAVPAPSEPHAKPKAAVQPSASAAPSAEKPLIEFLPGDAPPAPPSVAPVAPAEPHVTPKSGTAPASSSGAAQPAPAPGTTLPDGGWVKPAWAIPDGDPVRRAPITEDPK